MGGFEKGVVVRAGGQGVFLMVLLSTRAVGFAGLAKNQFAYLFVLTL